MEIRWNDPPETWLERCSLGTRFVLRMGYLGLMSGHSLLRHQAETALTCLACADGETRRLWREPSGARDAAQAGARVFGVCLEQLADDLGNATQGALLGQREAGVWLDRIQRVAGPA